MSEIVVIKRCASCGEHKELDLPRQPSGVMGRQCYCKVCFNARYRGTRRRAVPSNVRRARNFKARYGLTPEEVEAMLAAQGGVCAICEGTPERPAVDHDHATGKVRGILCTGCNIKLAPVENVIFRAAALRYLERHA